MSSTLAKALGLERKGPLPPKYQPKVTVRIICGRSNRIMEYSVSLPIDGLSEDAFAVATEKLQACFGTLGIIEPPEKPAAASAENTESAAAETTAGEDTHAQRRIRPDKNQEEKNGSRSKAGDEKGKEKQDRKKTRPPARVKDQKEVGGSKATGGVDEEGLDKDAREELEKDLESFFAEDTSGEEEDT